MLKNYLKTAWRNIKRRPIFSIINITGLAIGLAACIMIALWVQYQMSYDQFNKQSSHIYRLVNHLKYPGGAATIKKASVPLSETLNNKFSGIKKAIRVLPPSTKIIEVGDQHFDQKKYIVADPGFFRVFTFPLLKGSSNHLLQRPGSVVITKTTAQKYFPGQRAVGQTLKVGGQLKTVTGVAADPPPNSTLQFSVVETSRGSKENWQNVRKNWSRSPVSTYVLLNSKGSTKKLATSISKIENKHLKSLGAKGYTSHFYLQPLTAMHLGRGVPYDLDSDMSMTYVWLFAALALFILLLAAINYTNLATAKSAERAREVGIRKTLGAGRWGLAGQFLGEAVLTCLLALLLAFVIAQLVLPVFNNIADVHLTLGQLGGWKPVLILIGVMILLVIGSSWYPALLLSGFSPRSVFRNDPQSGGNQHLRKGLVVFQFTVAVVLIIATITVYWQLNYMRSVPLGFNKNHVVIVHDMNKVAGNSQSSRRDSSSKQQLQLIKRKIKKLPDVQNASLAFSLPTQEMMQTEFQGTKKQRNKRHQLGFTFVDQNYFSTLDIALADGRTFSNRRHISNAVILNKAAVQIFFGKKSAVGQHLKTGGGRRKLKVVGVIKNFHYRSLRNQFKPMAFFYNHGFRRVQEMAVRLKPGHLHQRLDQLKQAWQKLVPDVPFNYSFLDQQVAKQYKSERKMGHIFTGFCLLALVVACLGLFGLTTHASQRRTKEIGIRKVLGASEVSIVRLLSKDFLKLVAIGFVIAVPIGGYVMHRWLKNFAYKININPWIFLLAGGIALIIALTTVSYQSIRAALANPVDSIQSE